MPKLRSLGWWGGHPSALYFQAPLVIANWQIPLQGSLFSIISMCLKGFKPKAILMYISSDKNLWSITSSALKGI